MTLISGKERPSLKPRRLCAETLESRYCPAAPVISDLSYMLGSGGYAHFWGYVQDETPWAVQVTLSGLISGSTQASYDGFFSFSGIAQTLGTVTAVAGDSESLTSSPFTLTVTEPAPVISSLSVTPTGYGRYVTISGQVSDASPDQVTLAVSGVVTGTFSAHYDGSFSFTAEASSVGTVQVVATDTFGQQSAVASALLTSTAPTISNFAVRSLGGSLWIVEGHVTDDESVAGNTVEFGDLLEGVTTQVRNDGTFSHTFTFTGNVAPVSALVKDRWGLSSSLIETVVQ